MTQPGISSAPRSNCHSVHESPSSVHARLHFWFEEQSFRDRRRPANRLKRAVREAELLEERQIDYWLELGRAALQGTSYPTHKPQRKKAA